MQEKIVSAEKLGIRWIETRTSKEKIIYNQLVSITHNIIKEAFSTSVITPGKTTTDDVVWWMREKVLSLNEVSFSKARCKNRSIDVPSERNIFFRIMLICGTFPGILPNSR